MNILIKLDLKRFVRDRIWFGWCYDSRFMRGWYRGTNVDNYRKIIVVKDYD